MGSIAKKFVSRSLMFALFLSLGYLALPVSPAAQNYPEAVILEQKVKETYSVLQQRQREQERLQEQARTQRLLGGEVAIILAKAKAQHAVIEKWRKAHASSQPKTKARAAVHKKPLQCRFCL
jgi:hypothetical protein